MDIRKQRKKKWIERAAVFLMDPDSHRDTFLPPTLRPHKAFPQQIEPYVHSPLGRADEWAV
jgi:hypothetical protein